MDLKSIVEAFVEIERRFDVNSLRCGELIVWPLVRAQLWHSLQIQETASTLSKMGTNANSPASSSVLRRPELLQRAARLARFAGRLVRAAVRGDKPFRFDQPSESEILFFSRHEDHRVQVQDRFYDLILDPLIDLVQERESYAKWELFSGPASAGQSRYRKTNYLDNRNSVGDLLRKTPLRRAELNIRGFDNLSRLVDKITGYSQLQADQIVSWIRSIDHYRRLFAKLLDRVRPKTVFLSCYYSPAGMAMNWVSRQRGILTVDVQHGKQGRYHGMYSHWTKIPEAGYDLLPGRFWSWGEESRENIERYQPAGCRSHRCVVGGNRWLGQWVEGDSRVCHHKNQQSLDALTSPYQRVILVTLQPAENAIPPFVFEAMRQSPADWLWLIRMHPAQLRQGEKEPLRAQLQQSGVVNFDIDAANEAALYSLMRSCTQHVTGFSSTCYEALAFGLPTTLVCELGKQLYPEYLQTGMFQYAATSSDLLSSIAGGVEPETLRERIPYIETSRRHAESAMQSLLHGDEDCEKPALKCAS